MFYVMSYSQTSLRMPLIELDRDLTFQGAETLPHRDDDIRHVQSIGAHLEREGLVELWRHVTLDDVSSSRLNHGVLTHQTHLGVEVCAHVLINTSS